MVSVRKFWKSSPPEYKDHIFIYLWGTLWALVYLFITPGATLGVLNAVLILFWTLLSAAGGVIAVGGLVRYDNLVIERLGVNLLMVGPISYAVTQLGLLIYESVLDTGDPLARAHLIFFALWPYLFLNKRRRQLNNRVNLVRQIPLEEEEEK